MKILIRLTALALFAMPLASAQGTAPPTRQHARKTVALLKVEQAPKLDGLLDDAAWKTAEIAKDFTQKDPNQGSPATEQTQVQTVFDGHSLYFGIRCFDSNPEGILARELRRDNDFGNDDLFSIIVDTFHDHRNAFQFKINPRGTQYDALITEEGRDINEKWDEKWDVETHIDEQGWTAEMRLPLKSIRFAASGENPSFGIDFERVIRRKNEFTYWNNFSRNFNFHQVSQSGHLRGVGDMEAGMRLRIKPYINGRITEHGSRFRSTNYLGDVGLEDLKYPLTSGLTLDFTANTDFAQTEVDDQVINFDRVPVFFPEKREFFLEGAGIFEFGSLQGETSPEVRLYHSRRIGISPDGLPIPMLAGAKLTGKLAPKWTLGLVEAQTGEFAGRPGDNFGVLRIKRDLLERSSAGFFMTNRQGDDGDYNRVLGGDAKLVFLQHLNITGLVAKSLTDGVTRDQAMGGFGVQWQDDKLNGFFNFHVIQKNFNSEVGYVKRTGLKRFEPQFSYSPRPKNNKLIRQLSFGVRLEHFQRLSDGEVESEVYHFPNRINFHNGSQISVLPHRVTENLSEPFRLPGGIIVPRGKYTWWYSPFRYSFNPAQKVSGSLEYRFEPGYYGGRRHTWAFTPTIKFSQRFSTEVNYSINQIALKDKPLRTFHLMNNRVNFAFSRKVLTSTLIQYSTTGELLGVNFRFNYIYRPGDNLFIVYNNFTNDTTPVTPYRSLDRSFVVKLTHSFDF